MPVLRKQLDGCDHGSGLEMSGSAVSPVPEIVRRLETDGSDWAKRTIDMLRGVSPSALCWTLKALQRGADLTLPHALDAEFALTHTTMRHPDFAEGVRAMVVDKDRQPRWQPARIEDVDPTAIDALFG